MNTFLPALAAFVLILAPAAANDPSAKLSWAPPLLSAVPNPIQTIKITNTTPNNTLNHLDPDTDYILLLPGTTGNDWQSTPLERPNGLKVTGGRNIHVIGGVIRHDTYYPGLPAHPEHRRRASLQRAAYFKDWTGTLFIEGVLIEGKHLYEAINVGTSHPNAKLYLQNVRIDGPIKAIEYKVGDHEGGDALQTEEGPKKGIFIDRFTVKGATYQGIFLKPSDARNYDPAVHDPEIVDIRRFNIAYHAGSESYPPGLPGYPAGTPPEPIPQANFGDGRYFFWQHTRFPVRLTECYSFTAPGKDFGKTVWPDRYDETCGAIVSDDGQYVTWPEASLIEGRITNGNPSGGDFVPENSVGANYVSPGYRVD